MKNTRDYGKSHPRFKYAVGGLVRKPEGDGTVWSDPEQAHRSQLEALRQYDIEKTGKGEPEEYELEKNRGQSVIKEPLKQEYEVEEGSDEDQDLRDETERGA